MAPIRWPQSSKWGGVPHGHAEIGRKFLSIFERDPKVKVTVISRIVDGRFVIDKEKITGIMEGKRYTRYRTVIYAITGGLIREEWYLTP